VTGPDIPYTVAEFTPEMFPVRITWFRGDEIAHRVDVPGPGAVPVPALGEITRCIIECGDGTVCDTADPEP
jgi:hypothetical protein